MTSIGTGYDLSASTYSPDGRIFQVEYANKAVENSGTAIGLKVKDGVVLAVEKLVHSKLLVPEANRRIQTVDRHIGLAANYRETYNSPPPLKAVADRLGLYVQAYTLYSSVRPFGISTILGTVDEDGPGLFVVEPRVQWSCSRKGRQLAKTELEKLKLSELSVRKHIYLVHDDAKEKEFELEMSWIGPESNYLHVHVPKGLADEAEAKAKAALETFE
ncbi:20S proteasome subunit [Gymnopilus junonius]|uniref:Proteasome subunit alpha type n=1 Tax=Gymnopilus junonius TaxID=109634 RepID=A0A9P5P4S5_GYMJU|nr:20S proteasome subunit [Gymnopilus junonius]